MGRTKKVRRRRVGSRRARWIMAGLFLLGLAVGAGIGFYVHYYVLKPGKDASTSAGEASAEEEKAEKEKKEYVKPLPADPSRVQEMMSHLSQQIGVRPPGTQGELSAAEYLKAELESLGYAVGWLEFTLPNGEKSVNLVTADPGTTDSYTFLVGAHMDTRPGSPGANGNASGCAAVLELARTVKDTRHLTEIRFLLFGSTEGTGSQRTPARTGSTAYLGTQSPEEAAKIVGMVSLDTVAVGPEVWAHDWGTNSLLIAQSLVAAAGEKGLNASQETGQGSDHEPFGAAGIPAVWLERRLPGGQPDGTVGTSGDSMSHVSTGLVSEMVDFLRGYLLGLDRAFCKSATAR